MIKKNCKFCKTYFLALNERKSYCSKSCKQKTSYQKNKDIRLKRLRLKYDDIKLNNPLKYLESLSKNRKRHNTYYKNNPKYRLKQIVKTQEKRKKAPEHCANVRREYYLRVEKKRNSLPENRAKRQKKWSLRYYNDPTFRAREFIKSRLRRILKQNNVRKPLDFRKAFGINFLEFKKYIESKFKDGMSWSNYGTWHLDHIIPLSSFDLGKKTDYKKANHYTNFQPLWARENLKKSNKIINQGGVNV